MRANPIDWRPDFPDGHPAFSTIAPAATELRDTRCWPSLAALDECLASGNVRNMRGKLLRVVDADVCTTAAADFEARALNEARLAVRRESWHGVFNVLVWKTFPKAKAALNERHCAELRRSFDEAKRRGPVRDTLTLLDETGVIVAASDASLIGLIREFRWKELFWRRRSELLRSVRVHVFGHALYEKLLSPFPGVIGHAVLLEVEQKAIDAPIPTRWIRCLLRWSSSRRASRLPENCSRCPCSGCRVGTPKRTAQGFTTKSDTSGPAGGGVTNG